MTISWDAFHSTVKGFENLDQEREKVGFDVKFVYINKTRKLICQALQRLWEPGKDGCGRVRLSLLALQYSYVYTRSVA